MRKSFSVCLYLLVIFMLAAVGCGGGGGDGGGGGSSPVVPTVTPPSQSLVGTYRLNGFKINYSNGVTLTEKSVTSFSGTMEIGLTTINQLMTLNGVPVNVNVTSYSVTWTKERSEGIIRGTDITGTHDVSFATSGNLLHTYSGVYRASDTLLAEEWDYWEKTSDKVAIVTGIVEEKDTTSEFKFIGEILIEKNLIVME